MADNNQNLNGKMLRFVELASSMGKQSMDTIAQYEAREKAASEAIPGLIEHLISTKVIEPGQKQAAENALKDHGQTQALLKNAATKIQETREKAASAQVTGLGQPEGQTKQAHDPNDSLTDPFVGRRSSEKSASDIALFRGLGLMA